MATAKRTVVKKTTKAVTKATTATAPGLSSAAKLVLVGIAAWILLVQPSSNPFK
jgi:hypothetical protein